MIFIFMCKKYFCILRIETIFVRFKFEWQHWHLLRKINVEIAANEREYRNSVFWFQELFERVYNYFITSEFESSNKRDSINRKIDFHHSKKFHDDVLKYFRKYIKDLRQNMLAINVVNEFNRRFICVYRACQIDLKDFRFHSESRYNFQLSHLRQKFVHAINVNVII